MAISISFLFTLIAIGLTCFWIWKLLTRNHDFFKKQGLKYKNPIPLLGNSNVLKLFFGKGFDEVITEDYRNFPGEKVTGMFDFFTPMFFIKSPELVKRITVKDFEYFQDHRSFLDSNSNDIFKHVLFIMKGKQWRDMRSSLSPIFTGSKMRNMLQLVNNCAQQFVDFISDEYTKNGPFAYSTKDIFSRYTNDTISTCVFGVECDSLKYSKNEIYLIGQKMLEFQKPSKMLQFFFMRAFPKLSNKLGLNFFDNKNIQRFRDIIVYTMNVRKREGIERPDMIKLLMKLREGQLLTNDTENEVINGADTKRNWSDDELIAQCLLFFLAGFDTGSTVMNFLAYELAVNPNIQTRLINEVDTIAADLNGNPLTYESLQRMKYLDMVISETLRKWPPGTFIDRECVKDYSYEDENGLKFMVEKGNIIWIPAFAFHRDPKYFPNPEKFDPERFNDENKSQINSDIYVPFGAGPRICIGMRFGLMQVETLFYYLLANFTIKPSETTQIPLKLKKSVLALVPEKEIRLYIEPRNCSISDS